MRVVARVDARCSLCCIARRRRPTKKAKGCCLVAYNFDGPFFQQDSVVPLAVCVSFYLVTTASTDTFRPRKTTAVIDTERHVSGAAGKSPSAPKRTIATDPDEEESIKDPFHPK
jgi:hypothetical protein